MSARRARRPSPRTLAGAVLLLVLAAGLAALGLTRGGDPPRVPAPDEPLAVSAEVVPQRHLFGEAVEARVRVEIDPSLVDPDSVTVEPFFRPYRALGSPSRRVERAGGVVVQTLRYRIQCVDRSCAPAAAATPIELPVGEVRARLRDGTAASVLISFPPPVVASWLADGELLELATRADAQQPAHGLRGGSWLGWLALGLALLVAASLLRSLLRATRSAPTAATEPPPPDPLTEALARLGAGPVAADERRLQLDGLALALDQAGATTLAERARTLAWASNDPGEAEVARLVAEARR